MSRSNGDGVWKAVGASVAGVSHELTSLPCQDAHACEHARDGWIAIAVADGAGSAPLSEVGARTAVDCAVATLGERIGRHLDGTGALNGAEAWRGAVDEVLAACLAAVEREADARQRPASELACTLLLAVLGPSLTVVAQIGDGAIVVENGDGTIALLTAPDFGEDINATTFLVSPDAVKAAQFTHMVQSARSAAVFTDGIQMLTMKLRMTLESRSWEPHLPFFEHVFAFFHRQDDPEAAKAALTAMLTSAGVRSRTDDDVTLVVASRSRPAVVPEPRAEEDALAGA
jgi:hypothetical protein